MIWLIVFATVALFLFLLFSIQLYLLKMKEIKRLKEMAIDDLINQTFFYPTDYFKFIGETDESVKIFRELVERKDLNGLKKQWGKLEKRFRELETKAGHEGRPLILDYFCWYEINLKVLSERLKLDSDG